MRLPFGVEMKSEGEGIGVLVLRRDAVQTWCVDECVSLERRDIDLPHEREEVNLSARCQDEGRIIEDHKFGL